MFTEGSKKFHLFKKNRRISVLKKKTPKIMEILFCPNGRIFGSFFTHIGYISLVCCIAGTQWWAREGGFYLWLLFHVSKAPTSLSPMYTWISLSLFTGKKSLDNWFCGAPVLSTGKFIKSRLYSMSRRDEYWMRGISYGDYFPILLFTSVFVNL